MPEPTPLMFATASDLWSASKAIAPGYQAVGMRPSNFERPGLKSMTATLFWVPLQTYKLLPVLSKQRAFGLHPNGSVFSHRVEMVSTMESVLVSIRANLVQGGARIDLNNKADYTEREAKEAFDRMMRTHGWH